MRSPPQGWTGRAMRSGTTALRSAIGLAVTLLLLEAVLQVGAWARWKGRWQPAESPARAGERVVLCVGDSFTYGFGASSAAGSYPAQLETTLNESGTGSWKVINGAWPGQNSWEVLRKLGDMLGRFRPQFVYVLVGNNDLWSRPSLHRLEEVPLEGAEEAFEWKWRTARLLTILVHRVRLALGAEGGGTGERSRLLLGEWHAGELKVRFEEGGRLQYGATAARWRLEGEKMVLTLPGSPDVSMRWDAQAGFLALHPDGAPSPFVLRAGPPAEKPGTDPPPAAEASAFDRASAALASGNQEDAERFLREHVLLHPEDLWVRENLVRVLVTLSRVPEATEHVEWLRRRHEEDPDRRSAEALLGALQSVGERDESLRMAKGLVDRFPDSVRVWETIALQGFLAGERDGARPAIDRALAALPPSDSGWRAPLLRVRAMILREADPPAAMESSIRAFLLDGDEALLVQQFQMGAGNYTRKHFEDCLRDLSPSPKERERLEGLFRRGEDTGGPPEALEGHLRQVVLLCRRGGARPAFLSYPNPLPPVDDVMERLSREMGVPRLDVKGEFERVLRTRRREDLFVPDGHCNEEGYGIMSRVVARDALAAVR